MTTSNRPTIDNTPRWTYIQYLWTQEATALWLIPGILIGFCAGFALGWLANTTITAAKLRNLFEDFLPVLLGIGITVTVLHRFDKWRDDKREETRLKTELLWQIRSRVTDVAVSALDRLRINGWSDLIDKQNLEKVKWSAADLHNADLSGAHLRDANLSGAHLHNADLSGGHIHNADLSGAHLRDANLSSTNLVRANLSGAQMLSANLSGAQMLSANLSGAHLRDANLSGAQMLSVNLMGANLDVAQFDAQTQLPDNTYWTAATDMTRFTNPEHPQFWRSDISLSPAYRGHKIKG